MLAAAKPSPIGQGIFLRYPKQRGDTQSARWEQAEFRRGEQIGGRERRYRDIIATGRISILRLPTSAA